MNAASWIILIVVIAVVGLAIRATFFKKKPRGGCCDVGDKPSRSGGAASGCPECSATSCGGCTGCSGIAMKNNLQPIYKPLER